MLYCFTHSLHTLSRLRQGHKHVQPAIHTTRHDTTRPTGRVAKTKYQTVRQVASGRDDELDLRVIYVLLGFFD